MNDNVKALQPEARGQTFAFGLNPYGLTYHLGLQGAGGAARQPEGRGPRRLHRHRDRAWREGSRDLRPVAPGDERR